MCSFPTAVCLKVCDGSLFAFVKARACNRVPVRLTTSTCTLHCKVLLGLVEEPTQ